MYLPVPPQPDCANAWLEAVKLVDGRQGHEALNVVVDVADPTAGSTLAHPIVREVNDFLIAREKSVETIANTIFPLKLYQRYGSDKFIGTFRYRVLPKVGKNGHWSGYYFDRMTNLTLSSSKSINQLTRMIERMKDKAITSLHKHEISLFDPEHDVTDINYGGQCLSFLSFHLLPGSPRTLVLTAQYRNHFYVEKLLGNLIGLGRLMYYVANETGTKIGPLTVLSTHAKIDLPKATRPDIEKLIDRCSQSATTTKSAAWPSKDEQKIH